MVAYTKTLAVPEKAAKASISHLRVHYKHCREIAQAIKGRKVENAMGYLENVLQYKEAIPFTKYNGSTGRHAQGKQLNQAGSQCGWPQKATKSFVDLLKNLVSNAKANSLTVEDMVITHTNCNQAPKMRRRTYRAHGRVNAYGPNKKCRACDGTGDCAFCDGSGSHCMEDCDNCSGTGVCDKCDGSGER